MKVIVITTLMFLLIIAGWIFAYTYLNNIYSDLSDGFSSLSETVEMQDWDSAVKQLSIVDQQWKKAQKRFNLFINHQGIHDIELSLARTKQYIRKKELSLSLAEIEVLKKLIYMLKEDESPAMNNIF